MNRKMSTEPIRSPPKVTETTYVNCFQFMRYCTEASRIHSRVISSRSKPSALGADALAVAAIETGGGGGTPRGVFSSWSERCEERRDSMLPASEKSVLSERPVQREKSVLHRDSSPSQEPLGVGTVLAGRLREAWRLAATDEALGSVANCFCCEMGDACVVEVAEPAPSTALGASWLKLRSERMEEILKLCLFQGDDERMRAAEVRASSSRCQEAV